MGAGGNRTSGRSNSHSEKRPLKPILPKLPPLEFVPGAPPKRCYVCDERTNGAGVRLMHNATPVTNSSLPNKIGQLMGDGFLVVVSNGDMVCRKCYALISHVDQLEADLKRIKGHLKSHLLKKYNFPDTTAKIQSNDSYSSKVVHLIDTDEDGLLAESPRSVYNQRSSNKVIRPKPSGEEKTLIKCPMCEMLFESLKAMNAHKMKTHLLTWTCHFCNVVFDHEGEYLDHVSSHLSEVPAPLYDCVECDEAFPTKEAFALHARSHEVEEEVLAKTEAEEETEFEVDADVEAGADVETTKDEECESSVFCCDTCGIDFPQEEVYREHMQAHEESNLLDQLSFDVFETSSEPVDMLTDMFNTTVDEERICCAECKLEFDNVEEFSVHFKEHGTVKADEEDDTGVVVHNEEKFVCSCGAETADEATFAFHLQECHQGKISAMICPLCGIQYDTPEDLTLHFSICDKGSVVVDADGDSLIIVPNTPVSTGNSSLENGAPKLQIKHVCNTCGVTFDNKVDINQHSLDFPDHMIIKCPDCDRLFKKDKKLNEHRSLSHPDAHCRYCNKLFQNLKQLKAHESRHIRAGKVNFSCSQCHKPFHTQTGLKEHEATHSGQYRFNCEFCSKGFVSRVRAEEHRATHTKEERYTCEICNRKFSHQATFWIHKKWHQDPRPYKCDDCGRKFKHTSLLKVHKRKHTGERPYACTMCDQTFTVGNTLKRHMTIHTGVFPYTCQVCNAGYCAKYKLALHMSKVHHDHKLVYDQQKRKNRNFKMIVKDDPPSGTKPTNMDLGQRWVLPEVSDENEQYLTLKSEEIMLTNGILDEDQGQLVEIVLPSDAMGRVGC